MADKRSFSDSDFDPNPFVQFDKWYKDYLNSGISVPNVISLGTASSDGRVSARIVLLKDYNKSGFVFFTNYTSKKGSQISSNPGAALLFYWPTLSRQVRIEGVAGKISEEESESYFITRPRESQISAWASEQSSVIPGRRYLINRFDIYKERFKDGPVEKPINWGGFRLIPDWFEFWQEGEHRLHDRLTYTKTENIWVIERLAP
jgi:pyridoxamine-phosphate oxidase